MTKPLLRRSESLGYVVNHLARLFAKALHHEIARYEVVPGQFAQLLALYEEEGITQQELAARVGIEQPTMAATLQRMERDGLIERRPDPADGRRAMIYLTSRSRRLQGKLVEAARRINAIAIGDLGAPKTHEFFDTARSMATRLEDHLDAESALPVPRAR